MKTTESLMDELNNFIAANMAVETIEWTDSRGEKSDCSETTIAHAANLIAEIPCQTGIFVDFLQTHAKSNRQP